MKTDHALSELFDKDPDLIKLFVREPDSCTYRMRSETIKEIERRVDACFFPDDVSMPIIAAEFQGYPDQNIYFRLISGGCLIGMRNPGRTVHCLLVFLEDSYDPKTEPWHGFARSDLPGIEVVTFREVLCQLEESVPDHPLIPLIRLQIEKDVFLLRASMSSGLDKSRQAESPDALRDNYAKIYFYWHASRLGSFSLEEVKKMMVATPFEKTQLYKDLLEEAAPRIKELEQEREESKLTERIALLEPLRDEGLISEAVFREKVAPIREELDKTRSSGRNGQ